MYCMQRILFFLSLFIWCVFSYANNITISNVSLSNNNGVNQVRINFDVAWDNSWRCDQAGVGYSAPYNYDGAWITFKWRNVSTIQRSLEWYTATAIGAPAVAGAGGLLTSTTRPGYYLSRGATNGTGSVNFTNNYITWTYTTGTNVPNWASSAAPTPADFTSNYIEVCVIAIEMVYIPAADFYLGDGTDAINPPAPYTSTVHGQFHQQGSVSTPFLINTDGAAVGSWSLGGATAGNLNNNNRAGQAGVGNQDDWDNSTSVSFPTLSYLKGRSAVWCMKYEVSQGQYADFLNHLTPQQAALRYSSANYGQNRYTIMGNSGVANTVAPNFIAGAPERACNYLSWTDGCAYLFWVSLRPMTEMEYEKICRGPVTPLIAEFPWGTQNLIPLNANVQNNYTDEAASGASYVSGGNTAASTAGANCYSSGVSNSALVNPGRCGMFATQYSNREQAGATYYGVMDMGGNLAERVVSIGHAAGRAMADYYGNGNLTMPTSNSVVGTESGVGEAPFLNGPNTDYGIGQNFTLGWPNPGSVTAGVHGGFTFQAPGTGSGVRGGGFNDITFDGVTMINYNNQTAFAQLSNRAWASKVDNTRNSGFGIRGVGRP